RIRGGGARARARRGAGQTARRACRVHRRALSRGVRVRVDLVAGQAGSPEEHLPGWPLEARRQTAVVIHLLPPPTTLTVAFTHGARRVIPVASPAEALARQAREPDALLCGERGGRRIPDFHLGNSPAEYTFEAVAGRTLVFASTNGSLAMIAAAA